MSKKLNNLKWESVALEGFPASNTQKYDGFVGLEECTSYGLDKESKKSKKKKQPKRKLQPQKEEEEKVTIKKVKLSNGFVVEPINNSSKPSQTNENNDKKSKKKRKNKKNKKEKQNESAAIEISNESNSESKNIDEKNNKNIKKLKLGEDMGQKTNNYTAEDMLMWAEFKLQEPIMRALTELGFQKPTKIQQLTLPAAIHGRRDILGAAETGSGKTLAFGLPILSGILKLKEKAEAKGLDVYELPYKKVSAKQNKETDSKNEKKVKSKKNKQNIKQKRQNKKVIVSKKESSEDGYSSGENSDTDESTENKETNKQNKTKGEDFIEEYDVPVKKRNSSTDDIDSGDDDSYIHLSEMLDSDDLAENSDDDDEQTASGSDDEIQGDGDDVSEGDEPGSGTDDESQAVDDMSVNETDDESGVNNSDEDFDEQGDEEALDGDGIGCVKVIDNIEIPGHEIIKTGKPLYALILTPTRELAIQISRHLIAVAKYTGIKVATIVGGMAAVKQERVLRAGPEVVVATPGRLWELVTQGQHHLAQLHSVKFLAIDETDRMIERGHFEELHPLLERLNVDVDKKQSRQNFVFSATLTLVHDLPAHMRGKKVTKRGKIINRKIDKMTPQQKIKRLVDMIGMTDPKVVDITTQNLGTSENLTESRISCSMEHKDAYLYYILKRHPGRTMVFCNSIGSVRRLAQILTILKCNPLPLHASMPQRQRLKNLERFRDNPHGVLIATDVAARGLDIPLVDHVIQYQVPRTAENYVHRAGRTARAERDGLNVLMVEPAEAYLYSKLCHTLNKTSEVPTFPVSGHLLSPFLSLVSLAREIDALELKRRRALQAHGWREKAAKDLDIIIDEDDVPVQSIDPSIDRALKAKRRQLDSMVSRPMFPKGFSFKYPTLNDPTALEDTQENALQVMKKSLQSGELKKEKRKSKNAPLLKLGKGNKKVNKNKKK